MRIVWVNRHAAPVGGAERYLRETAAALAGRGHRSWLLYEVAGTLDQRFIEPFEGAFPLVDAAAQLADLRADAVYVQRCEALALLRALAGRPEPIVRFWHDHERLCLRRHKYTALGRRTCAKPVGAHCYLPCLGFLARRSGFPPLGLATLGPLRAEHRLSADCAAHVVASRYLGHHLAQHGIPETRIHVAPLYANPPPEGPAPTREPGLVLAVGQLVAGKGIDVLLRALARLDPRARLEIAGDGAQREQLERLARELGVAGRVRFLGRCDDAALDACYRRASVVAFPSRAPETFGLVGPEAMCRGLPVVATAVGGTGEWLEHGVTGFAVASNDAPELAAALACVLGDPALAVRLGEAGRRRWEERFRPEHHLERLERVLAAVAARADDTRSGIHVPVGAAP